MKKLISITLIAVLALSIVGCQKKGPEPIVDPIKDDGDDVLAVNPFKEVKTMEEAEKLAGFKLDAPEAIEEGYKKDLIEVIEGELIQVSYIKGEDKITLRKAKGDKEISGDYNEYNEKNKVTISGREVSLSGFGGKVNKAEWLDGEYSLAILVNPGGTGMAKEEIIKLIETIDSEDVQLPNPFKEVKTMEEAEKSAGFKMVLPKDLPEGMTQNYIEVIEKEMIQVNYNNKENNILIRKAKSSEEISGDYNEYENTKEITVGDRKVTVKGNGNKLSVATWTEGEFAYSVGVMYESWAPGNIPAEEMGIEENVMIELIKAVK